MFGLVFILIVAAFVYRKAKDNGYIEVIWWTVAAGFFGVQVLFSVTSAVVV